MSVSGNMRLSLQKTYDAVVGPNSYRFQTKTATVFSGLVSFDGEICPVDDRTYWLVE
jgi:hypothetical protein